MQHTVFINSNCLFTNNNTSLRHGPHRRPPRTVIIARQTFTVAGLIASLLALASSPSELAPSPGSSSASGGEGPLGDETDDEACDIEGPTRDEAGAKRPTMRPAVEQVRRAVAELQRTNWAGQTNEEHKNN